MIRSRSAIGLILFVGCTPSRPMPPHPHATSDILGVDRAEHAAALEQGRWSSRLEAERLYLAVVKVTVQYSGVSTGSAIVLCQRGRSLFALTARHVLRGSTGRPGDGVRSFTGVQSYRFEFHHDEIPAVQVAPADAFVRYADDIDVAMVRIDLPTDAFHVPPVSIATTDTLRPGAPIHTVGYAGDSAREWAPRDGQLLSIEPMLRYSPLVEGGYSGGPLFDAANNLVGINVHVTTTRGDTTAVPIRTAIAAISNALPQKCVPVWQ